jgi:hypothetical protein
MEGIDFRVRSAHSVGRRYRTHDAATRATGCLSRLTYANRPKFHFTVNQDSFP